MHDRKFTQEIAKHQQGQVSAKIRSIHARKTGKETITNNADSQIEISLVAM